MVTIIVAYINFSLGLLFININPFDLFYVIMEAMLNLF